MIRITYLTRPIHIDWNRMNIRLMLDGKEVSTFDDLERLLRPRPEPKRRWFGLRSPR